MPTRYGVILGCACLVLGVLWSVAAAAQEKSGKEESAEKIKSQLEGGEWKDALKSIKTYRRKFAKTDEEKKEADAWKGIAEGNIKFDKIQTAYRKKEQPRKASKDLMKLMEECGDDDDLMEKASTLLEAVRSTYVLSIEDFEDWDQGEGVVDDRLSRRQSLVKDPNLVKHGEKSLKWTAGRGWGSWSVDSPQPDWTEYDFFCVWIYNEKLGQRPGRIEIEPYTGGWHYFQYYLAIDWVGWREIRMPLQGGNSKFGRHGAPDWKEIERVDFDHDDDVGTTVEIIIDDIRLEKATK